jgi:hypothetical protein
MCTNPLGPRGFVECGAGVIVIIGGCRLATSHQFVILPKRQGIAGIADATGKRQRDGGMRDEKKVVSSESQANAIQRPMQRVI